MDSRQEGLVSLVAQAMAHCELSAEGFCSLNPQPLPFMDIDLTSVEVIFFDAAGTLFHVRGSVGEIYSTIARKYHVESLPADIEEAFAKAYRRKSAEGVVWQHSIDRVQKERRWWMNVVRQAFAGRMPEPVLRVYFDEVFDVFRGADGWALFPDTRTTLEALKSRGYRLGVLSNFDSRLNDVLVNLGIEGFFDDVIFSWYAGAAKPEARIFHRALRRMGVPASSALHVGDSLEEDFDGATRAGMRALLIDRTGGSSRPDGVSRIASLNELCSLLKPIV